MNGTRNGWTIPKFVKCTLPEHNYTTLPFWWGKFYSAD